MACACTRARDLDVFSGARACNDPVYALGDVLELFVAEVEDAHDNPSWLLKWTRGRRAYYGAALPDAGVEVAVWEGNFTGGET